MHQYLITVLFFIITVLRKYIVDNVKVNFDPFTGEASDPFAPKITASSMLKLQEHQEASRNFLKYYESKDQYCWTFRTSTCETGRDSRTQRGPFSPHIEGQDMPEQISQPRPRHNCWLKDTELQHRRPENLGQPKEARQLSADSDKENSSVAPSWARRVRKVAQLSSLAGENMEGTSEAPPGNILRETLSEGLLKRKSPEAPKSPVPVKLTKRDEKVLRDPAPNPAVDEATQTEAGQSSASKVTLVSRKRIVSKLGVDKEQDKGQLGEKSRVETKEQAAQKGKPSEGPGEDLRRPWRVNMKESTADGKDKDGAGEVKKRPDQAEKPWRTNMKAGGKIEATAEVIVTKKAGEAGAEDKPWRINMKKVEDKPPEVVVMTKKRHYGDRDDVRKYKLEKQKREKALREEKEREGGN